jgi:hypothetical protein
MCDPMMVRAVIFLIGFGLAVSGGVSFIAYLNLLTMGHSFGHYLSYIVTRPECYLLLVGILMITGAIFSRDLNI